MTGEFEKQKRCKERRKSCPFWVGNMIQVGMCLIGMRVNGACLIGMGLNGFQYLISLQYGAWDGLEGAHLHSTVRRMP